jgi:hypothetical protein
MDEHKEDTHRTILILFNKYLEENALFDKRPSIRNSIRTRAVLMKLRHAITERRKEIIEVKNAILTKNKDVDIEE